MISKELIKKIKYIEIKTKMLVNNMFGGEYHSAFKGAGMEFNEVREYLPGDDIRSIDWNVTAKYQKPYLKIFEEERELNVLLAIDISGSSYYGSNYKLKKDTIIEIASILSLSASQNNDKVGILLFSNEIELFIPPNKGRVHILRIIRELLIFKPINRKTSIRNASEYLTKILKRKTVIFFMSDFFDKDFEKSIDILNKKHDLICLKVNDNFEYHLKKTGLLKFIDNETNKTSYVDLINDEKLIIDNANYFNKYCDRKNIDLVQINNNDEYIKSLVKFFRKRSK
ncbi:MAG: DUF58 domain-containing protein [Candidatus Marinimicrobia bacterium]|nr:DUF58 domain-containing protein [Candidatus Neomarinimicrobiota bacterium]|tara:strand:+ start:5637 stop:6488 length:852 start_codon:yes stop_codon:yes gene_type:complete